METKEIVFSVIGAANPVTAELDLLLTTPEGSRVIIITDDRSLMVRAGKVRRDMPNYHEWAALMTEEHKRVVTHYYNSYPMSHNGIPAVNIPASVFKRVDMLQAEINRLRSILERIHQLTDEATAPADAAEGAK